MNERIAPLGQEDIDHAIPADARQHIVTLRKFVSVEESDAALDAAREQARGNQEKAALARDRQEREKAFRREAARTAPNLAADLFNLDGLSEEVKARLLYIRRHEHINAYCAALGQARINAGIRK